MNNFADCAVVMNPRPQPIFSLYEEIEEFFEKCSGDEVDETNVPYRLPQWLYGKSCLSHMMYRCNFVHHVPKCMSCNEAIDVITGKTHCFHDCIYIMPVLLLWDVSSVCRRSLTTLIQVWNIARHFSLSCFRCVVNSSVDRTEAYVWTWPILIIFVKLHCNRLGSFMMLC